MGSSGTITVTSRDELCSWEKGRGSRLLTEVNVIISFDITIVEETQGYIKSTSQREAYKVAENLESCRKSWETGM
jgi:hypothetical protein